MKNLMKSCIAALAVSVSALAAQAADTTLTISSWAPPTHGMNAIMWPELVKQIQPSVRIKLRCRARNLCSSRIRFGSGS